MRPVKTHGRLGPCERDKSESMGDAGQGGYRYPGNSSLETSRATAGGSLKGSGRDVWMEQEVAPGVWRNVGSLVAVIERLV